MVKIRRIIRVILLIIIGGLFIYAFYFEKHDLHSFVSTEAEFTGGDDFVEDVEGGQLIRYRKDNKLYDAESLVPDAAQTDDCPT